MRTSFLPAALAVASLTAAGLIPRIIHAQDRATPMAPALAQSLGQARRQGCEGRAGASTWRHVPALDDAARRTSTGAPADQAARESGYRARSLFHVNLSGYPTVEAVAQELQQRYCAQLIDPALTDVGVYQQGRSWWVLMAAPFTPPAPQAAGEVSARVLALVNQARAAPRRCGDQSYAAAPALRLDAQLQQAAATHAQDMARRGMLEHTGSDGSSPADRATRAGYAWRSIGENIASGQPTPDEVVAGWLRSPPHCANIMQQRFTDMGVAFASTEVGEGGIYWSQSFGRR